MPSLRLVIHERLGHWARHLRPRLVGWPIAWVETRSTADLEAALTGTACPIVVIDVADRPRAALEDLDRAIQTAPNALVLVLDPGEHAEVSRSARELGASHVMAGGSVPPAVTELLLRWLRLAQKRNDSDGWSLPLESEHELWSGLALPPFVPSGAARATRP